MPKISTKNIRNILYIIGILFIFLLIQQNKEIFTNVFIKIKWMEFSVSVGLILVVNFMNAILFKFLLQKYTINITLQTAFTIFSFSQIAKYIPGKIWSLLHQTTYFSETKATATILIVNIELALISIFVIGTTSLMIIFYEHSIVFCIIMLLFGFSLYFLVIHSCYLNSFVHYLFTFFCKKYPKYTCQNIISITWISLYFIIFAIGYLISHLLMLYAVFNMQWESSIQIIAYLGLSWVVGMLVFITPSGMGVREVFFIFLGGITSNHLSFENLAAIAVFTRLWFLCQEAFGVLIILIFNRITGYKSEIHKTK